MTNNFETNTTVDEHKEFMNNSQNNEINLFGQKFKLINSQVLSKQKGKNNIIFLLKFGQEILNIKMLNTGEILYSPNGEYKRQNFIKIVKNEIIINKHKSKNPKLEEFKIEIQYEEEHKKILNKLEEMRDFTYGLSEEEKIDFENRGITTIKELLKDFKLGLKKQSQDIISMNKDFIELNYSYIEKYKNLLKQAIKLNLSEEISRIKKEIKELEEDTAKRKKENKTSFRRFIKIIEP